MLPHLSPKTRAVAILMVAGCTTKEIGRRLSISPRTVDKYRERIYQALEVRTLYGFMKRVFEEAR